MSTTAASKEPKVMTTSNKKKHPALHLLAGGAAGLVESSVCHPLDTIKTRIQLQGRQAQAPTAEVIRACTTCTVTGSSNATALHEPGMINVRRLFSIMATSHQGACAVTAAAPSPVPMGPIGTARCIVTREGFPALYKGLTAVWTGIVPKMAIRFLSFEWYREQLGYLQTKCGGRNETQQPPAGQYTRPVTFLAGLASGLTEAILVVTPAEVCKIRMQSQYNSTVDKGQLQSRKYTNVVQTATVIVREEGLGALYAGVVPTMMRQGCNQAVNFTTYNWFKDAVIQYRKDRGEGNVRLRPHESLVLGGISGGFGPLANNPLDVVKTRMQKQVSIEGVKAKYNGLLQSCVLIAKEEGTRALWKGITPRLLRIMPGQAITFTTYEFVSKELSRRGGLEGRFL